MLFCIALHKQKLERTWLHTFHRHYYNKLDDEALVEPPSILDPGCKVKMNPIDVCYSKFKPQGHLARIFCSHRASSRAYGFCDLGEVI